MTEALEQRLQGLREDVDRLRAAVGKSFLGHQEAVELLLLAVLAEGHVLLEGAPGLGKTTLVRGLAQALGLSFRRIQFTPDLMPGDVIGTRLLEEREDGGRCFRFEPGPIFANLILADEVNRATPRTQSALLEAMQEAQVTVHGETLPIERPFTVVATQNPIEMEGTYPLPEAQLDRFLVKIELESPSQDELVGILAATTGVGRAAEPSVLSAPRLRVVQALVREVPASSDVLHLAAAIVLATDPRSATAPDEVRRYVRYGASPRGAQAMLLLAKARALVAGRLHASEEDVRSVAMPALRHRLILNYEGEASLLTPDDLVARALQAAGHRR